MRPNGTVTLLTDFGLEDAYVGAMKGAILKLNPSALIVDLTHGVRPYAVLQGAFLLDSSWRSFPAGTVHVAVVDPGVGTDRKAIAFRAGEHYFVGPDNGLFTFLTEPIAEAVELPTPPEASPTFHGRDVFGPAAARLSSGTAISELGSAHRGATMRLSEAWASKVGEAWRAIALHCDHFGNVISNLPLRAVARIKAVNGTRVRTVETYEQAEPNELVALVGSSGRIEFALREGSAAARLHASPGESLVVT
jgi:S-adenosylmethionine hydrolase